MKVLLLAPIEHDIPPRGYGPWELIVYNLAEALVELGVDVTVYATKQAKTGAKLAYYWDKPLSKQQTDSDGMAKTLIHITAGINYARRNNFSLIHNHLNIEPVLFAKAAGLKSVTTLHGAGCEKKRQLLRQYVKKQPFVSISYAERKADPDLNYIANVYNGVDFSLYKLKQKKGDYLAYAGRIHPEKGVLEAIMLAKQIQIPLKIAGIIDDKTYYNEKIRPELDNKLISFVGNLEAQKYTRFLSKSLALLFFVKWEEPFGLAALDAVASGVPVIGFCRGALPEIIYDQRMGILVNSISEAVEHFNKIAGLRAQTIRSLAQKRFSREAMGRNYLKVYQQICLS